MEFDFILFLSVIFCFYEINIFLFLYLIKKCIFVQIMKKVTSVLNIDEFPFRISGDESSKKRRRLDKSFQHSITADRWLMS